MGTDATPDPTPGKGPQIASVVEVGMLVEAVDRVWAMKREKLAALCSRLVGPIGKAELELLATNEAEAAKGKASKSGSIAVIPLKGLITPGTSLLSLLFGGGYGLQGFRQNLASAVANPDVTGIVMDVDSPGGYVDLVPEVAAEIRAARDQKPIAAVANTSAFSAAYWLASQAHEVIVSPSAEVGSIGVYSIHEDISQMLAMEGVKLTFIQAGDYKTEGNPYEPLGEDAAAALQQGVDDYYGMFVADVAKGRGVDVPASDGTAFGGGRTYTAKRAVSAGLADRVDTLEGTVRRLASGRSSIGRQSAVPELETVAAAASAGEGQPQGSSAEEVGRWLDLKVALGV